MRAVVVVLFLASLGLAGCSSIDPACQAAIDAAEAHQADVREGKAEPSRLAVRVLLADDGSPMKARTVVADLYLDACPFSVGRIASATDADGVARMDVTGAMHATVWVPASADTAAEGERRVPVLREAESQADLHVLAKRRVGTLEGGFGPAVREHVFGWSTPSLGTIHHNAPWPFHEDPAVQARYMDRLERLDLELRWQNQALQSGHLRGCVETPDGTWLVSTASAGVAGAATGRTPGSRTTQGGLDIEAPVPAPSLLLCADVEHSVLGLGQLPYALHATAQFSDFQP